MFLTQQIQISAPIYDSAYQMLWQFLYGNAALTADQTLVLTFLSTIVCLAVIGVPVFCVYSALKFIFGWR